MFDLTVSQIRNKSYTHLHRIAQKKGRTQFYFILLLQPIPTEKKDIVQLRFYLSTVLNIRRNSSNVST